MEHKAVVRGIYFVAISGFEFFFGLRNSFQSYVSLGKYFSGIFPRVSSSSINFQRKNTQKINTANLERQAHTLGSAKRSFSFD